MNIVYNPFDFMDKVKFVTLSIVGSFVTMKFLNALYENLYEPMINNIVKIDPDEKYYFKIGSEYIDADGIIKEFIKWILLVIVVMMVYNCYFYKR